MDTQQDQTTLTQETVQAMNALSAEGASKSAIYDLGVNAYLDGLVDGMSSVLVGIEEVVNNPKFERIKEILTPILEGVRKGLPNRETMAVAMIESLDRRLKRGGVN